MSIVVDASVLLALLLPDEPLASQALQLINQAWQAPMSAPHLLKSEVTASLRKGVYSQRIPLTTALVMLQKFLNMPIEYYEDTGLLVEAFQIASELNQPRAYDSQYLALAQRLAVPLWTADKRLFNSAASRFQVHWLGEFGAT